MQAHDLKLIPGLQDLPVLSPDDPFAGNITARAAACEVAEADDLMRVYDLLHRDEYEPLAAVRCACHEGETVRVYFKLRDRT